MRAAPGVLLLIFSIFIAGTGSAIWSWQRLKPVLLLQGAFEWLCETDSTPVVNVGSVTAKCLAQENALTAAWRWGCTSPMIASFFIGALFDRAGARLTGIAGQLLFLSGFLCFSAAGKWPNGLLYYVGFCFIGIAQVPVFTACVSVSNLFPKTPNLIISVLSSAGDFSYNVPLVVSAVRQAYLSLYPTTSANSASSAAFFCYATVFCGIQICVALLFLPSKQFEPPQEGLPLLESRSNGSLGGTVEIIPQKPPLWHKTVFQQVASGMFLLQLVYFSMCFLQMTYINGAVDAIIGEKSAGQRREANIVLEVFRSIQGFSFLFSLSFGAFADCTALHTALFLHNTFAVIAALSVTFVPYMWFLPVGFIAFQFFASFVFSQAFCWVNQAFGLANVNLLMALVTGPVGVLQLLLDSIKFGNLSQVELNYRASLFFMVVTPFLYAVPAYLMWHTWQLPVALRIVETTAVRDSVGSQGHWTSRARLLDESFPT